MIAIDIQSVVKRYQQFVAVNDVSLQIQQGEFFGLLGPNGAGKTTLISMIAGLAKASEGSIHVMGHNVLTHVRDARRSLGVVPQELVFDPFFTVRETLRFQSGYYGIKGNDAWIDEVLENLGLMDKANTNMRALSGGMKRRVLVAQALVHKPPVIILDEPTAGVDVELRQTLWQFISRLNREGHTIVLTTHYLEEAENLCSRIGMLKQGRLIALESTQSLLARFSAQTLVLRYEGGALPSELQAIQLENSSSNNNDTNKLFKAALPNYADLEPILAKFRQAELSIIDCQIQRADLEDVFVHLTHN